MGRPQIAPVTRHRKANTAPTGASARAARSARLWRQMKYTKLAAPIPA